MNSHVQRAGYKVREADRKATRAAQSKWVKYVARIGYLAKGIVYTTIGLLAFDAAMLDGGRVEGSKGALREIASHSYGQVLLTVTVIGLFAYAAWRAIQALLNPQHKGDSKKGKIAQRIGYGVSAAAHVMLALYGVNILTTADVGSSGGDSRETLTARLLAEPFGRYLVGAIGLLVIGVGLYQLYKAYKNKALEDIEAHRLEPRKRRWVERIGRLGFTARAVIFGLIGWFLIQAALQYDPSEAGGLGQALREIASQSYGSILLGLVAVGLLCYAAYCFVKARYMSYATAR